MEHILDLNSYFKSIKDGSKIIDFISKISNDTKKGKYIINDSCFINVTGYKTKKEFDNVFESHKVYTDIHIIISGEEKIFYGYFNDMNVIKGYDYKDDYELLKSSNYKEINCHNNQAVIFKTNEPHMAGFSIQDENDVLKVIVKIEDCLLNKK